MHIYTHPAQGNLFSKIMFLKCSDFHLFICLFLHGHRSVTSNIKCFIETNDKERMTLGQCLILGIFPAVLP